MKAKDIADVTALRVIETICIEGGIWANTWQVYQYYPGFPFKVVAAKLSRLLKRDLVTGCDCGCRGDWELTAKGRRLAGIEIPFRPNPADPERDKQTMPMGSYLLTWGMSDGVR